MTTPRDAFLERVRRAVAEGNRAGSVAPLPQRGSIGYQGAGPDPAARFCNELTALGGHPHMVPDRDAARDQILQLVGASSGRKILLESCALIDELKLAENLQQQGHEIIRVSELARDSCREPFFAADVGITGVDYLLADTGSVVHVSGSTRPRSVSLLPPVHIALAEPHQVLPDLFDLFAMVGQGGPPALASCLSLITGPSKTGDIELRLVTGVHGPGEIHVILLAS